MENVSVYDNITLLHTCEQMCPEQSDVVEEDTNFVNDAIGNNLKNFFAEEDVIVKNCLHLIILMTISKTTRF